MFDNKYLLKGFIVGGIISGVIAGLILEIGFSYSIELGGIYRMFSDIIIALVFTFFSTSQSFLDKEYKGSKPFIKNSYLNKNKASSLHSFD